MRSINTLGNTILTATLLMALAAAPAFAQSASTASQAGPSSGGPQEGIKVHGDWTLTVRNPDGSVAGVHEFKNALSMGAGADRRLTNLLGGVIVPGQWIVSLNGSPNDNLCGSGFGCLISEVPRSFSHSSNLTKTIPTSGPDVGKLVLRGSVRVLIASNLSLVTTQLSTCPAATAPAACVASNDAEFTRKFLATVIPVSPDQLVEVKVVISFS